MSSKIPSELLVPRANNGLIDTYPDMNYGLGALEKTFMTDGTADHTSGLPDGVVRGEDEGLGDLGAFMREGNLADLSFIDVEGDEEIQKLANLKIQTQNLKWHGANYKLQPYAEHQKDLTAIPKVVTPKEIEEEVLAEVAMKCARLLHAGANMNQIQKLAFDRLGMDVSELKGDFQYLEEERGLMGNVYVLASAYPNIESGQWNKEIKKASPHAQYLLVDEGSSIQKHDTFNGMFVVTDVPYKKAFEIYKPLLEASGRKVAGGNPREILKQAFLTTPRKKVQEAWYHKAQCGRYRFNRSKQQFAAILQTTVYQERTVKIE